MSEHTGLMVIIAVPVVTSILFHFFRSKYYDASVLAAITSALEFQLIDYFDAGFVSPFFPIMLVTSILYSLAIALIVGIPFFFYRRHHRTKNSQGAHVSP
jgi:predicted neutral ceramidase superfamily lipid hydrolase